MTASAGSSTETRPVNDLRMNPLNPRDELHTAGLDELAESIRAQGVLQPLLVTPGGVVVAGHRRLAAARLAGLTAVPVVVRDLNDVQQQEIMLVENLQRQDLSAVELSGIASGTTNSPPLPVQVAPAALAMAGQLGVPAIRALARNRRESPFAALGRTSVEVMIGE